MATIKAIGIDIVKISRIQLNQSLIKRVLHPKEQLQLTTMVKNKKKEYIAGRWALKEAIFKATGINIPYNQIAIGYNQQHQPTITAGLSKAILLSLSHDLKADVAVAVAIYQD